MASTGGILAAGERVIGWAFRATEHGVTSITFIRDCSRESAVSVAKAHGAEWCRPYVIRDGQRVIGC